MRVELDAQDLAAIASQVAEALRPLLVPQANAKTDNMLMTVADLAEYLQVSKSWVYSAVHLKQIPFTKHKGKHPRFRRSDIDEWLETEAVRPE